MSESWAQRKMIGLDFETTGPDPEEARAVTASLIVIEPGRDPVCHSFLVDPGVEIPQEAVDIHKVTNERARAEGMPPADALGQLDELLAQHWTPDVPLVAYNGRYDLTVYDRERIRNGQSGLDLTDRYMVCPLTVDRHVDRFRKGSRKLADVCKLYRVELLDAHTSDADTLATLRLAYMIAMRYPRQVGLVDLPILHANQIDWHRTFCLRMATFLRKEATRMETSWPRAQAGDPAASRFIAEKLARLEITDLPDSDLIAQTVAGTRDKADSFSADANRWPITVAVAA